jgi:hypothetical protein
LLCGLVGFIFLIGKAFEDIAQDNLPRGTPEEDASWVPGRPARIYGFVEAVFDDEDPVRIRVRRIWEEGQPSANVVMAPKTWKAEGETRPEVNDILFIDGRVEKTDAGLRLRVPALRFIRPSEKPGIAHLVEEEARKIDWNAFLALPQGASVRVTGQILWRDPEGFRIVLGEGVEHAVDITLKPLVTAKHLRLGERVTIRGIRQSNAEDPDALEDLPKVTKGYIRKTPLEPSGK